MYVSINDQHPLYSSLVPVPGSSQQTAQFSFCPSYLPECRHYAYVRLLLSFFYLFWEVLPWILWALHHILLIKNPRTCVPTSSNLVWPVVWSPETTGTLATGNWVCYENTIGDIYQLGDNYFLHTSNNFRWAARDFHGSLLSQYQKQQPRHLTWIYGLCGTVSELSCIWSPSTMTDLLPIEIGSASKIT